MNNIVGEWQLETHCVDGAIEWKEYQHTTADMRQFIVAGDDCHTEISTPIDARVDYYVFLHYLPQEIQRWLFTVTSHDEGENIAVTSNGYIVENGGRMGTRVTDPEIPNTIRTVFDCLDVIIE